MNTNMKPLPVLAALTSVLLLANPANARETTSGNAGNEKPNVCLPVFNDVLARVTKTPDKVLEIVSAETAKTPKCACEIIKAAISGSKAKPPTVAAIVEAALNAAPEEHWPVIVQCALAAAPDALREIREIVTRVAGNNKSLVGILDSNPLDFPGSGGNGMSGGGPAIPPGPAITPVNPPKVTEVDP